MRKAQLVVSALLLVSLLLACAPQAAPAPQAPAAAPAPASAARPSSPAPVPAAPVKAAWETKWEQTMVAAQKEGRVSVATSGGSQLRTVFSKGIKEAFGLEAEALSGTGAGLEAKVLAERRAGLYLEDVYLASPRSIIVTMKANGALERLDEALILPEINDPKAWYKGALPWIDKDHLGFAFSIFPGQAIAINTTLVKPEELKSWRDLLDPKWKGKLALNDPTTPSAGSVCMAALDLIMGWDFVKEMAKVEPIISRDQRQQLDWLAHGKISVLVAPKPDEFTEFLKLGAPVALVDPVEGTWLSSGAGAVAMFNKAPRPNAAKIFINWLLSKEAQTLIVNGILQQSAREDVSASGLPAVLARQQGRKYTPLYDEPALIRMVQTDNLAKDVFGPLTKK